MLETESTVDEAHLVAKQRQSTGSSPVPLLSLKGHNGHEGQQQ